MRFNLVSNLTNGVGLSQDYAILRAALEARGHQLDREMLELLQAH